MTQDRDQAIDDVAKHLRCEIDAVIEACKEDELAMEYAVNQRERVIALERALREAGYALNLGLNLAYKRTDGSKVDCVVCNLSWPLTRHEDGTSGSYIEHALESTCGIMHSTLQTVHELLGDH